MTFRTMKTSVLGLALLGLSGCMNAQPEADWNSAPAERPAYDQSSEATQLAEAACRAALASKTGQTLDDTRVDYVLRSEAGLGVWMSARGAQTQWLCQSDSAGNVSGLGEAPVP